MRERDDRAERQAEREERPDAHEGRHEQRAHQRPRPQRQHHQARRVEGLVAAGEEQREHRPAEREDRGEQDGDGGGVFIAAQRDEPEELQRRHEERGHDGGDVGGLAAGRLVQAVAQEGQLQSYEDGRDGGRGGDRRFGGAHRVPPPSQSRCEPASRPLAPTSSRNASWRRAPRRAHRRGCPARGCVPRPSRRPSRRATRRAP